MKKASDELRGSIAEAFVSEKREIRCKEIPDSVRRFCDQKHGSEDRREQKHGKRPKHKSHKFTSLIESSYSDRARSAPTGMLVI